jgi:PIN domain nuclease of toxin-antitoxin system
VILLDTNALLWLQAGHRRTRTLERWGQRLYVSPVSLLEIAFLLEAGRVRLSPGASLDALGEDDRWLVDDPPFRKVFEESRDLGWTRDPFDRLLAAHAAVRRWRLATADTDLIAQLGPSKCVEL